MLCYVVQWIKYGHFRPYHKFYSLCQESTELSRARVFYFSTLRHSVFFVLDLSFSLLISNADNGIPNIQRNEFESKIYAHCHGDFSIAPLSYEFIVTDVCVRVFFPLSTSSHKMSYIKISLHEKRKKKRANASNDKRSSIWPHKSCKNEE